jgi:hypothetical protein
MIDLYIIMREQRYVSLEGNTEAESEAEADSGNTIPPNLPVDRPHTQSSEGDPMHSLLSSSDEEGEKTMLADPEVNNSPPADWAILAGI